MVHLIYDENVTYALRGTESVSTVRAFADLEVARKEADRLNAECEHPAGHDLYESWVVVSVAVE